DGLINGKGPGKPSLLNDVQRAALAQAIERGLTPYLDRFQTSVSEETLGREVLGMGYRKLSARPRHHAQNDEAAEAFTKLLRRWAKRGSRPMGARVLINDGWFSTFGCCVKFFVRVSFVQSG